MSNAADGQERGGLRSRRLARGGGVAEVRAEGARVFLAGRAASRLDEVAERIRADGGSAHVAKLDALDERAVDIHADEIAAGAGSVDISFNLISHGYAQGTPMAEMALDDYVDPVRTAVRTNFLTWRAASRHMVAQGGGVILVFGGEGPPPRGAHLGSLQVALHAVEAMRRQLSAELGAHGVRVVTLRTGGVPETIPADVPGRDSIADGIGQSTLLGRAATLEDVGAFVSVSPKAWAKIDAVPFAQLLLQPEVGPQEDEGVRHSLHAGSYADSSRCASLQRIKAEGIENVWERHRVMSEACQAGILALGLEVSSAHPAEGLTAFRVPEGIKDSVIRMPLPSVSESPPSAARTSCKGRSSASATWDTWTSSM